MLHHETLIKSLDKSAEEKADGQLDAVHRMIDILFADLGMQRNESTVKTPERFVKYLLEFMQPFNPKDIIGDGFEVSKEAGIHGMVTQTNIPFRMICEHHLLPAIGTASIGYVPTGRVIGLSKMARLVDAFGTLQPSLQEIIAERIADVFMEPPIRAAGVIVVISAEHGCMACRGVNAPNVVTGTSVVRGVFRDVPAIREEFFNVIRHR